MNTYPNSISEQIIRHAQRHSYLLVVICVVTGVYSQEEDKAFYSLIK